MGISMIMFFKYCYRDSRIELEFDVTQITFRLTNIVVLKAVCEFERI